MDFDDVLLTYATIYINSLNEAQAIKENSYKGRK